MNSHCFTGTKMFNRQAGDGLILGGLEYRDSDGLLKNTSVTRLVMTSLSNLYHGKLETHVCSWIRTSYVWVAASCTPHTSTTFASDKLLVPNTVTPPGKKLNSTHWRLLNLPSRR